jgi:hypothetical protein
MGRNLTIHLDETTITQIQTLAARQATSVSRLVATEIERLVGEDDAYRLARTTALGHLEHGFRLGGATSKAQAITPER